MSRFGWLRPRIVLGSLGVLFLAGVLGWLGYFVVANLPLLYGRPVARAPISWTSLPVPVVVHSQWTSYSSVESVRDVFVTADFLWIATDGGLVVYDRVLARQVVFQSEHGLPSNRLTAVEMGADGRVWVAAESGGVGVYDGSVWTRFLVEDGLPSNSVADVVVDGEGVVWAATDVGIGRYDGDDWQWVRPSLFDLSETTVRDLAIASSGLWAATAEGLWHFDGRSWETFSNREGMVSDNLYSVAVAADGAVWAGGNRGLSRFDGARWERFAAAEGIIEEPIVSLVGAADGSVWLAYGGGAAGREMVNFDGTAVRTESIAEGLGVLYDVEVTAAEVWVSTAAGLGRFERGMWETVTLESEILSNGIGEIVEQEGVLWLASDAGVQTFDGNRWGSYTVADGLQKAAVRAIDISPGGEIVVGYERPSDGVSIRRDGEWLTQLCVNAGVDLGRVYGGALGPEGDVWFLGETGVGRYGGRVWTVYRDGWPREVLPRQIDIAPDGTAWVGLKEGLYRLDESGRWVQERNEDILRLSITPSGGLWFGTPTGLYHRQGGQDVSVPTPEVNGLQGFLATDAHVWISDKEGVWQLTGDGWRRFTTAEGLASNSVTTLTLSPQGEVWAAYEAAGLGFSVFDGERWQILHNSQGIESGGLASDQVNDVLATPDGMIWFGTDEGVSRYDVSSRAWGTIGSGRQVLQLVYAHGEVWVRTAEMTARVSGTALRQTGMLFSQSDYLAVTPEGELWAADVGQAEGRFHLFDGDSWGIVPAPPEVVEVVDMAFEPQGRPWLIGRLPGGETVLYVFYEAQWHHRPLPELAQLAEIEIDRQGRLWLGGFSGPWGRLFAADEAARLTPLDTVPAAAGLAVQNLAVAADGGVWGTVFDGNDVQLLQLVDGVWQTFPAPLSLTEKGEVSKLEIAPNGAVWVSTSAGVGRYVDGVWETVRAQPERGGTHGLIADGPPRDPVNHIGVTADDAVWFGSSLGQVGQVQVGGLLYTPERPLANDAITAVLVEPGGAVWVSNITGRMYRYENGVWQFYDRTLATAEVQALVVTETALWLGTDEGIVRLKEDGCQMVENRERDLFQAAEGVLDEQGNIWWGTENAGAVRYDVATAVYGWPELSLRGRHIQAMTTDLAGGIWFYYDGTLVHYRRGRLWETIRVGEGLAPFERVTALAIDGKQRPWLGTERGVVTPAGSPTGRRWARLTAAEGLAANEVREILRAADGSLWFVTAGGLSRYRP